MSRDFTPNHSTRFAVDAHVIGRRLTGNEVYIRNLLQNFAALDKQSQFLAYLSVPASEARLPDSIQATYISGNPLIRLGWQMTSRLRRDQPALVHVQYTAPLSCPSPIVVSVHDVSFLEHPEFFSPARAFQLRQTVRNTVRRAVRILTPSEFSRREIEKHYPEARGRTTVAHNAVSGAFRPVNRDQAMERIRARFGISAPFLLNVGDLQPRKNQIGLIHAFEELLRTYPQLQHQLVLTGQSKREASQVIQTAEKSPVASRIHFTGFVTDDELRLLYNAADAFLFPSLYEGFGIPILEAMACGCPVICSNASAMPEVADGAAIFFDPRSRQEMTRAMRDVVLDAELRTRLGRLGQNRAAQFTWEGAARKTLEVYYEVAGSVAPPCNEAAPSARAAHP